jgi:hypothetical protein
LSIRTLCGPRSLALLVLGVIYLVAHDVVHPVCGYEKGSIAVRVKPQRLVALQVAAGRLEGALCLLPALVDAVRQAGESRRFVQPEAAPGFFAGSALCASSSSCACSPGSTIQIQTITL